MTPTTIYHSSSYRDCCTKCPLKTDWMRSTMSTSTGRLRLARRWPTTTWQHETRAADHVSDDDDDDEPEEPALKKSDARKGLAQAIGFCEQNLALSAHLDNLWKAMRVIETYSGACVQKTILDFMKKWNPVTFCGTVDVNCAILVTNVLKTVQWLTGLVKAC